MDSFVFRHLYHTIRYQRKMFSEITFSKWNIHGLINKVLGDKTKNKDFVEAISNIDFMFLTETWNNQDINIPGFETINSNLAKPKSKYAC